MVAITWRWGLAELLHVVYPLQAGLGRVWNVLRLYICLYKSIQICRHEIYQTSLFFHRLKSL